MPRSLEELVKEDLGAKEWVILVQRQQLEALHAEVAALKAAREPEKTGTD